MQLCAGLDSEESGLPFRKRHCQLSLGAEHVLLAASSDAWLSTRGSWLTCAGTVLVWGKGLSPIVGNLF